MSEKRNKFISKGTFFQIFSKVQYSGVPAWLSALSLRLLIFAQVLISEWWDEALQGLRAQRGVCWIFSLSLSLPLRPKINKYNFKNLK